MSDATITVDAILSHDGLDVGRDIKTGLMAKFRLPTMAENHFFLTVKLDVDRSIPHGGEGRVRLVLVASEEIGRQVQPGSTLLVYGLPNQQVGTAKVENASIKIRA